MLATVQKKQWPFGNLGLVALTHIDAIVDLYIVGVMCTKHHRVVLYALSLV